MPDSTQAVEIPAGSVVAAPPDEVARLYRELETRVHELRPNEDLAALRKAFEFAAARHQGQKRVSGEPYMVHPLLVARQLADMNMDMVCLETGLLHDVVEDTTATIAEIRKEFGDDVARCVDGVTKLSKLNLASREERQAESVRKMLLAMVNDIRVILVKLADRLHNMRTLGRCRAKSRSASPPRPWRSTPPSRTAWAWAKSAASWRTWPSNTWSRRPQPGLLKEFEAAHAANEAFLAEIKHTVEQLLAREGIPARVDGRLKRAYSVFQKLKRQKIGLDQVYDLLAVRIITDSVKNCYAALGVIHNEWHPIPGRIKDFIAIPRPNLYQSLHTSRDGARRAPLRSADPHRRDAPRRRGGHRRALEVQGRAGAARPMTTSASPGCANWSNGSAICTIPASSCPP